MGVVWVARHGETDWNRERRIQGHLDPPLNDTGRDQVADLAARLAGELEGLEPLPRLISSDLLRASQTAELIGRPLGLTPTLERDWRERRLGILEGKTFSELRETHPAEVEAYRTHVDRDAIPEIEPTIEFRARVLGAIRTIGASSDLALVVTHGGVMRVLLEAALGEDKQFMISNASLYRFYVNADVIRRIG